MRTTDDRPFRPAARALLVVAGVTGLTAGAAAASADVATSPRTVAISGDGVHHFTTAIVHQEPSPATAMTQRSTDVVELHGDLEGYLLYHVTSVIDPDAGRMVNTGEQWFSGTVLGEGPVVLHDDTFRFEVDLATGATTGEVHLRPSSDAPGGPVVGCDLDVLGTGLTEAGDATFSWTGTCRWRGR